MHDISVKWPDGARCAVMLTFDFDAETLWTSRDAANAQRPGVLSQGRYGAKVGIPKILDVLDEARVPSTFFIPGWTIDNHTDRVKMIRDAGHELAHHSYSHRWVSDDPQAEVEEIERGLEAFETRLGIKPRGYRSPAGEVSPGLLDLLVKHDFLYNSSLMDDVVPYQHVLEDGRDGPVELPWHWSLDDAPYALFSIKNPRPIFTNQHMLQVFTDEFDEIYRWGGLYNIIFHPQICGRPSRIALLRDLIAYIKTFPNVWFATGSDVADAWRQAGNPD